MTGSYATALAELARVDSRVVVLTAENRAAIRGISACLDDRFIDVGICEQTLVGIAAGLALRGRRPVVHALAAFLTMRGFEFVRTDVGLHQLPAILVGYVPGVLSTANGPTHQALEDIALMRSIPGMNVYCPASEQELARALPALVETGVPWYVRFCTRSVGIPDRTWVPGRALRLRDGHDVTLLTYGALVGECCAAADILAVKRVRARVVHMRCVEPLDTEEVLQAARETRFVVTVEDHFLRGALASAVTETLVAHREHPRFSPISLGMRWFRPAPLADVLRAEGLTGEAIARHVMEAMRKPMANGDNLSEREGSSAA